MNSFFKVLSLINKRWEHNFVNNVIKQIYKNIINYLCNRECLTNVRASLISFIFNNKYILVIFILSVILHYFNISTKYLYLIVVFNIITSGFFIGEGKILKFSILLKKIVLVLLTMIGLFYYFEVPIMNTIYCEGSENEGSDESNKEMISKNIDNNQNFRDASIAAGALKGAEMVVKATHPKNVLQAASAVILGGLAGGSAVAIAQNVSRATSTNKNLDDLIGNKKVDGASNETVSTNSINSSNPTKSNISNNMDETIESVSGDIIKGSTIEIPLLTVLNGILSLNGIEFILITSILFIILRLYFSPMLKTFILRFISYIYKNNELLEKEIQITNMFDKYNKQIPYILVALILILLVIKTMNIYYINSLLLNIDSFVNVYNFLKKNSLYLFFTIKKKGLKNFLSGIYKTISKYKFSILTISSIASDLNNPIKTKLLLTISSNHNNKSCKQLQIEQLLHTNQAMEKSQIKLSTQDNNHPDNQINKSTYIKGAKSHNGKK